MEAGVATTGAAAGREMAPTIELSVIVPTFNERDNIARVVDSLERVLGATGWEVIFVDDASPDGTSDVVRAIAARDPRVRLIYRVGRRGLSGACIEGMLASTATFVAVMDGDMQHDERLLPQMRDTLRSGSADLVVGSRYVEGGSADGLSGSRLAVSRLSGFLARRLLRVEIADPMSGFFMMRQDRFKALAPSLSTQGFKILLDIAASAEAPLRIAELPYVFRDREAGESKLGSLVALDYAGLLIAKLTRDLVPVRFVLFCFVGAVGIAVHLAALRLIMSVPAVAFLTAQAWATLLAMTSNFAMNNALTYRDQKLKGFAFLRGLLFFYVVCSIGVVANVGVASLLYGDDAEWFLAGLAGAVMGTIWNYAMSSLLVWRTR